MPPSLRFRVWHIGKSKMYPVTGLHFFESGELSSISIDTEEGEKQDIPLMGPVMQFTGSRDKNGKDIFEGDILDSRLEVYWDDEEDGWRLRSLGGPNSFDPEYDELEVIGNIYENPELLPPAPQPL